MPAAASLGVVAVTSGSNCCTGQKTNGIVGNETKQGGIQTKAVQSTVTSNTVDRDDLATEDRMSVPCGLETNICIT